MDSAHDATPWKPLVACPDAKLARTLRGALGEAGLNEARYLTDYPPPEALAPLAAKHGFNLCFVDVASDEARALKLVRGAAGIVPVVVLNARSDADLILRCLRHGAAEFLDEASGGSVRGVLDRLGKKRGPAHSGGGALYCLIPAKPGCGASTLAAHLAVQLSAGGRKVLLVDADPLTGSVGFMLRLKSEFHLGDVVRDWKRMDEDLWRRLTAAFGGIDVLLAPENPSTQVEITEGLAADMTAFWKERYGAIVVDMPDVRAAATSGFAVLADQALLVSTNELAALHATRRALDYLSHVPRDRARIRLVVNRYAASAGLRRDDLKTALDLEPFAVLANDFAALQGALLEGKPAPPDSRFRASVHALARQLCGEPAPHAGESAWWRRFAKRKE